MRRGRDVRTRATPDVALSNLQCMVLEILRAADRPLGAYDVLDRAAASLAKKINPMTIYRTLQFLRDRKLVARIESQNAYVPCAHPDHAHQCVFLICRSCSGSQEIENKLLAPLLAEDAARRGFAVERHVIELRGLCADCTGAASASLSA